MRMGKTRTSIGLLLLVLASVTLFFSDGARASVINSFFIPANDGATATNGKILEFNSQTGVFVKVAVPNQGTSQIEGMTMGPDGYIYASYYNTPTHSDGRVLRVDTISSITEGFVSPGSGGLNFPLGLAFGPDGNLYVANNDGNVIRYDGNTGAFISVFATGLVIPQDLTFGPDGDLYVSNGVGDSISRYDGLTGAFTGYFVAPGAFGLDAPIGMAFGPSEDLYVASFPTNTIFRFGAGSGALISKFSLPTLNGYDTLLDVAFGPDKNLYAAMRGAGTAIFQIDPDSGNIIDQFATLPDPLGFNTGMLFLDQKCSQLGSVSGSASGCFVPTSVLEPGSLALSGIGLVGLVAMRRRQANKVSE